MKIQQNEKNSEQFRERYWDAKVLTEGFIASVWAPYDFYLNGFFSLRRRFILFSKNR